MAWGKKPWQGGTRKKSRHYTTRNKAREYEHTAFDLTSPYRKKREADNAVKGFFSMIVFTALIAGVMVGLILFFHWVGVTFR